MTTATAGRATSAITAMWARDNPVSRTDDVDGRGYAPAAPARLAAFAAAGQLREVFLAAPAAGPDGLIGESFGKSCCALAGEGIELSAVGGDPAWLAHPDLMEPWLAGAHQAGSFDRVHLGVEPWTAPEWATHRTEVLAAYLDLLDRARVVAGPLPVDVAVPWWFAHEPFAAGRTESADSPSLDGGSAPTVFDAVLARSDRVSILARTDHAQGAGGILALTARAVRAASAADRAFTIGVETATPEVAGGAEHTFFDEGPVALLREAALVRDRLATVAGYRGVAVADHRSWRRLLGV